MRELERGYSFLFGMAVVLAAAAWAPTPEWFAFFLLLGSSFPPMFLSLKWKENVAQETRSFVLTMATATLVVCGFGLWSFLPMGASILLLVWSWVIGRREEKRREEKRKTTVDHEELNRILERILESRGLK